MIPRGGAVIWFSDGSSTMVSDANDVILFVAEMALHGIRPIQIDYGPSNGIKTKTVTFTDGSTTVVPENDLILAIATKALQNQSPINIQDTLGFSPYSVHNYPVTQPGFNSSEFLLGMLACAGTAAIIASIALAPEATPLELTAEEIGTEGLVISSISYMSWAHGASELIGLSVLLGGACVTLTAGSFSSQ